MKHIGEYLAYSRGKGTAQYPEGTQERWNQPVAISASTAEPKLLNASTLTANLPRGATAEAARGRSSVLAGVGPKKKQRALPGG